MDAARGSRVTTQSTGPGAAAAEYGSRLAEVLARQDWSGVERLANELRDCWSGGRNVLLCGNGGSAANAIHLANDFVYSVWKAHGSGPRVIALAANPAALTGIANDEGFAEIFAMQLVRQARAGDVLIVLSGSGNSANIIRAIEQAQSMSVRTYAIVGYSGGRARTMADVAIHVAVDDMQIAEDMQLVVGHAILQWLRRNPPDTEE
jgi:D-sedoheptulose 7-phosphate isomerase